MHTYLMTVSCVWWHSLEVVRGVSDNIPATSPDVTVTNDCKLDTHVM